MTYITWKDEVESYLGNLSASEKQKVFSYFAEMYADKRDAGISEERIVEGFGAPYDVAKRILADCKEEANADGARKDSPSGGNNYNYNYYNYNYGGAPPAGSSAYGAGYTPNSESGNSYGGAYPPPDKDDVDVSDIDMPLPEGTPKPKNKNGESPLSAFLKLLLLAIPMFVLLCAAIGLTVGFFSAAIGCIVGGGMEIGEAVGAFIAGGHGLEPVGILGGGLLCFGIGLMFIPLTQLFVKLAWKIIRWVFRKLKSMLAL